MKKSKKFIQCSLLVARTIYEEHFGDMPGEMAYINALKSVVGKIGFDKTKKRVSEIQKNLSEQV